MTGHVAPGSEVEQAGAQDAIVHHALLISRFQRANAMRPLNVMSVSRGLSFQAVMHRFQLGPLRADPRFQSRDSGLRVFAGREGFSDFLLGEFDGLSQGVTF
jgi:hypothetical protein